MSESSPANQALIAYVIGIILLLAFSMLIGVMMSGELQKQSLILLNPLPITSQVLNTGDSELCKKRGEDVFVRPSRCPFPTLICNERPYALQTPGM